MLVNAGKTLFLGESVKVFLKEISTLIGELRRADSPLQSGWAASTLSRAQREQTGGEEMMVKYVRGKLPECGPCLRGNVECRRFFFFKLICTAIGNI